ncbi:MAG: 4-hydroxybenzoate 3-monooxygenase [Gemmatimonadetes bacterium]|nr:4-hydroxybenzoate 3-monooxygenase [Gemmatimonadota bacterium]
MRTQVGIVGAGPAGLFLSHRLARAGIDSVVLERRSEDYVIQRVRAGVLEPGTVSALEDAGLGARLAREGLVHDGFELRFGERGVRIDLRGLTGQGITIYGQQEVVKDLIAARRAAGAALHFEVPDVAIDRLDSERPRLTATIDGHRTTVECDVVAGCDGFHGISRGLIPASALREYSREYPYGWLGILVSAPPSSDELIYAWHERGFALHSMRSPTVTRLYLQCDPDDRLEDWSDGRIWAELDARLTRPGWQLGRGPILERGITPMRSYVAEPMRYRRLFLAGDAAHIVPPTGAKGLNLAIHDVGVLCDALVAWYREGTEEALDRYSDRCLARVWRAQAFSARMTTLLHRAGDDRYEAKRQRAELEHLARSIAAATTLAEDYLGIAG